MRLGPAATEQSAGLRLAGLEGNARPAEVPAQLDEPPVMRALIQEKRFAGRNAPHVDAMLFQLVRERLLHVEQHAVKAGKFIAQAVEQGIDIGWLRDCAVEIGA